MDLNEEDEELVDAGIPIVPLGDDEEEADVPFLGLNDDALGSGEEDEKEEDELDAFGMHIDGEEEPEF